MVKRRGAGILMRHVGVLLAALCLAACGGGGGGEEAPTAISLSRNSLAFTGTQGDIATPQVVNVHFKGSGVLVGFAPGVTPPSWLEIQQNNAGTATDVEFAMRANISSSLPPGTYGTSVRFVTGIVPAGGSIYDATNVVYADLPINLAVINFTLYPDSQAIELPEGQTAPTFATFELSVPSAGQWTTSSNQSWLTVQPSQGTGPAHVTVNIATASLTSGSNTGVITVNDGAGHTKPFTVYVTFAPPRLAASPGALTFDITNDTSLPARSRTLTITDQLNGQQPARALSWTLSSITQPWLSLSASSGSSSPPQQLTATVSGEALAGMANGDYTATIKLAYQTSDGVARELWVPANLHLNSPVSSIELQQSNTDPAIAGGAMLSFSATGTYADGYQQDLTQQLTWASSSTGVATVGNVGADKGKVQPVASGTTTITATDTASAVAGSVVLTVKAPTAIGYVLPAGRGLVSMFVAGDDGRMQRMSTPTVNAGGWPHSIAFGADGKHAYVSDADALSDGQAGLTQYRVEPSGLLTPLTPKKVPLGSNYVASLAVDSTGQHLYGNGVCGGTSYCVRHIAIGADGTLTPDAQPTVTSEAYGDSIVASPVAPYLYRLESNANRIGQYAIGANGALTPLNVSSPATGSYPIDLAFNAAGTRAYLANFTCCNANAVGTISQYNVNGDGSLSPMAVPSVNAGKWPYQMIVDPSGTAAYLVYRAENSYSDGVATFSIGASGALTLLHDYNFPYARRAALDPTGKFLYLLTGFTTLRQFSIGAGGTLTEAFPALENVDGVHIYVRPPPSGS
jgi:6-phosphogluconolactonase (cycloisomerase 2 family)